MRTVAILGAGDLGATLARLLAEREVARRIVLVDPDDGRARGKALDIMQSGPVDHFDVRVDGCASLDLAGTCDLVVVADHPALDQEPVSPGRAARVDARRWRRASGRPRCWSRAAGAGAAPRSRARARRAARADARQRAARVRRRRVPADRGGAEDRRARRRRRWCWGRPPRTRSCPQGGATVAGVPVERLSPVALRRALEGRRPPDAGTGRARGSRRHAAVACSRARTRSCSP